MIFNKKYSVSFLVFVFGFSFLNLILYHLPLLKYAVKNIEFSGLASFLTLFTVVIAQFFVTVLILSALGMIHTKLVKFFATLFFITNSIALYFVQTYSTILTKAMMGNVFNTNQSEASELFSFSIIFYIVFLGLLPAFAIQKFIIKETKILRKLTLFFASLAFVLIWGFANSPSWLWFDKHSKNIGGLSMPWSYVINAVAYKIQTAPNRPQTLLDPLEFKDSSEQIVVLVIGESARSDRFGLYGYSKETTPLLKTKNIVVFNDPISCTTYTTASINCILSHKGSKTKLTSNDEPLTSYLKRFGVGVIWRSKNWGEPNMQTDLYQKSKELKTLCNSSCENIDFDEILLFGLSEAIRDLNKTKTFVVLHQSGSHGPTYNKKYPSKFEQFKPVCSSVQLQDCTKEELDNAYDNTIIYTDYFLSTLIDELKTLKKPTVMLYISDHGESLGESGFYLHGTPNMIAPKEQRAIPFILWMSDEFKKSRNIENKNIVKESSYSQDYIFHSVLGAFDANSTIYNERFDIFK